MAVKVAASAMICLCVAAAVLAPQIAPHSPDTPKLDLVYAPPFWMDYGSLSHPLGGDGIGRDNWSRLVYGTRTSLVVALGALAIGGVLGTALGGIFGYARGLLRSLFEEPSSKLAAVGQGVTIGWCAIGIASMIGPGVVHLSIAFGLVAWLPFARAIRRHLIARNLPPDTEDDFFRAEPADQENVFGARFNGLASLVLRQFGFLVILESVLSFLGLGVPPISPSWGGLVWHVSRHISVWWIALVPLSVVILFIGSCYTLGSWFKTRVD